MRHARAATLVGVLMLWFSGSGWAQARQAAPQPLLDAPEVKAALARVEAQLAETQKKEHLAGLSVAVICDQQIAWSKGFGYADVEKQVPATPATIYRIGSVTKVFTDTMLMQLRDAGRLALDDPLEKYLPEVKVRSRFRDARPPTFRQIASHTAGLPREPASRNGVSYPSPEAMLEGLAEAEMALPAMTEIKYSNLGLMLVGHTLAHIAGQPYQQYVAEHILAPLGMHHTGWTLTEGMRSQLAVGYLPVGYLSGQENQPRKEAMLLDLGEGGAPIGGLYSSVEEVARLVELQFREGPAGGSQILGGTTLREMRAPAFVYPDWSGGIGIGWWLRRVGGHTSVYQEGVDPGFCAMVEFVPDLKLGLVMLSNDVADRTTISGAVLGELIPAFTAAMARQTAAGLRPLPPTAKSYVGRYLVRDHGLEMEIAIEDAHLSIFYISGGKRVAEMELLPEDDHTFVMLGEPAKGERVVFEPDPETGRMRVKVAGYLLERVDESRPQ